MLKTLSIFDLLPFIHAGHMNKYSRLEQLVDMGSTWKTQVTPTGGTSWVMSSIYEAMQLGDVVVCSDRTPTIKRDILPSYKSNRQHDNAIRVERDAAEYILQQCNVTVLARVGYEADDIIYSLVKKYHDQYDRIYIYTGDSDLYFLVDNVVSIKPSSSQAKTITMENYEQRAHKKGMKYNCMTTSKIISGDTSDCIPALPKEQQYEFAKLIYREEFFPHLGDKDFVRFWVKTLCPWALPQVELVFPLDVDDLPDEIKVPDKRAFINWGDAVNNPVLRGRCDIDFDVLPYVKELQSQGCYIEEEA